MAGLLALVAIAVSRAAAQPAQSAAATAESGLLYPGATSAKWLFPQEKAILHTAKRALLPGFCSSAAQDSAPSFEVASIKPSDPDKNGQDFDIDHERVLIQNYTLRRLIRIAYGLKMDQQIEGGAKWTDTQRFDISAKIEDAEYTKLRTLKGSEYSKEFNRMLQSFLAERFQLRVTTKERIMPVYALVVAKSEAKLTQSPPQHQGSSMSVHIGGTDASAPSSNATPRNDIARMTAKGISMDSFADTLTGQRVTSGHIVINRTGLAGDYDFNMIWTSDRGEGAMADASYPGLFTALREQLGLKLENDKGPIKVIMIDAAAEPVFD